MKKRLCVFFAAVFFTVALIPSAALADSTPIALSTVTGSSLTDGVVYAISTEAELAKLAALVNGGEDCAGNTFILTANISLSEDHNGANAGKWVPIGSAVFSASPGTNTSGHAFNGSFFAQGYRITDLDCQQTSCSGLFGHVGSSGLVADLMLLGTITGADCAGAIAAVNQGKIINCINNAVYSNTTTTGYDYIGGIVGANQGSVQNCKNFGTISGYQGATGGDAHVGGIVGFCKDNAEVLNCRNDASVTGWSNVGGVVGDTSSEFCTNIVNSYNQGHITAEDVCGGVVGVLNNKSKLYNCYNAGTVSTHTFTYSGAIAGIIGFFCLVEHNYYLDSSFSKPIGDADSTDFFTIAFHGPNTLFATASPWGTFSLVEALNGYVNDDTTKVLLNWAQIGVVTPYFTGYKILEDPKDDSVSLGSNTAFTALVVGDGMGYQWQVSTDGTGWANVTSGYGYNYAVYITPDFTADMDGNQYRCLVGGTLLTDPATLSLNAAPVITTQPVDAYAKIGDPIEISLTATGSPAPTYEWSYSFDNIDWFSAFESGPKMEASSMDSMIDGLYVRCVVYNTFGSVTSNAARFHVATAPVITTAPSDKTAAVGKTATFSAAATGGPAPTYQWQVNRGSGWSDLSGADKASYTTADVILANDGYQYRVVVTNTAGSVTSDPVTLHVVENADIPSTGDTAQPGLWLGIGLFALTALAAIALVLQARRKNRA
ncbi:MAG: immunoglobulin domain-containing protein [Clostridiaceae bacterium]